MTARRVQHPLLDALSQDERAAVLVALLQERPELLGDAERLAALQLALATRESVADEVVWILETIPPEDITGRSGPRRGMGYVHPNEAAWELLGEAITPYEADIVRRAKSGMVDAAREVGLGVIAGLYRCLDTDDDESVLACAPACDAMPELAAGVIDTLKKAGVPVAREALGELCPEWDGLL